MKKTYLGIDMGYDSIKLALVKGGKIKKSAVVPMPENFMREGRITAPNSMADLLRRTMREHHLRASYAAVVLSGELTYLRTTNMPLMAADQLVYNIPYEFRDYITGELKNYVFDYAVLSVPDAKPRPSWSSQFGKGKADKQAELAPVNGPETPSPYEPENGGLYGGEDVWDASGGDARENAMELMIAAVPVVLLDELRDILRKAGLKLAKAVPVECAYISLLRNFRNAGGQPPDEFCILDLGYRSIRMYLFQEDRHMVTRVLEAGMNTLDRVIADAFGVDVHLAHTYLLNNYEDCLNQEYCRNAFGNIAVELMRAMNYYRFSNPDSRLSHVWLCGGGAVVQPLREAIAEALDMPVRPVAELLPDGTLDENWHVIVQAAGVSMDDGR